jgi:D-alanyl-D-alanine carboxypeptidase
MFKLTAVCVATLIALQAPAAFAWQTPVAATDAALASQIDSAIAGHFKADQPGATVIVTKNGKTVLRKAYGLANVEQKLALQPDMTMRLGSITKQFTAVAILMLAEQGKLSLDDEIGRYVPDYPAAGKKVTIAQLLNHTSGVASYTSMRGFAAEMHKDFTVTQMIDRFKDLPLDFAPGQDWIYSNSGYFLLGAVIEKVSGKPYADFVAEQIFKPLAMDNSAYEGHERGKAVKASGYSASEKGFVPTRVVSMTQPYAAGSLVSTVDDLARWDAAISSGKLLKAASWQRAFTGTMLPNGKPTNYGLGWQVGTLQGEQVISHGGGIPGFSTYAIRIPAKNVYVAVLTNADSGLVSSEMVTSKAAAIAIGKPFPELKPIEVDAKLLGAYEGVYKIDEKTERTFRLDGAKLTMTRTGRRPVDLLAYKADAFYLPNTLITLEFARDASGKVVDVTVYQNGSGQRATKLVQ